MRRIQVQETGSRAMPSTPTSAPGVLSFGSNKETIFVESVAARSIPFDSIPRITAGFEKYHHDELFLPSCF